LVLQKLEEATGAVKAAAKKDRVIDWISGDVGGMYINNSLGLKR
tara:strand:- start:1138 stop:1269 length:132 start_codon:yes stop_codon:yes gene_type:complete